MFGKAATFALVLATFLFVSASGALAREGEIYWKSCAGVSTILSEKNACYIVNLANGQGRFEIELCAGINITAGTIVLGAKPFSTMLCTTVQVTGGDREAAKKKAQAQLEKMLREPKVQQSLKEHLSYAGAVKRVGPVELKEDPKKAAKLKKAIEKNNKK